MQIQSNTAANPARPRKRKLFLPLALTNKQAGQRPIPSSHSLSGPELRQVVAGMLG